MSDAIGPVAVDGSLAQGPLLPGAAEASEATQTMVDSEVRRIVDGCHREVTSLLESNRDKLDALVRALLEHETLDEADAYAAAGIARAARVGA
jgi:cell division protease FtsH